MPHLKTVAQLVQSLTKTEKRNFKLFTGTEVNTKAYMKLFELILSTPGSDLEQKCRKAFPGNELNTAASYLYTVLMKSLMLLNHRTGTEERILTGIYELKLLFRKDLIEEGFEKLDKLINLAADSEKFEYLIILEKLKLHYLNRFQFREIPEDELIKIQSQLKKHIQSELNLTEHASLYELLNYRFVTYGNVRSSKDKEKLNDLIFTEMNLAGNHKFQSFNLKKNHLLFQSVYFMMTGDNKSSLNTFYELNGLFEQNRALWTDSPMYYIQHLRGILNNLHITGQYEHMQFFIEKLLELHQKEPSIQLEQAIYVSKTKQFLGVRDIAAAKNLANETFETLSKQLITPGYKAEVVLYTAITHFFCKDFKNAARLLRQIIHLAPVANKQTTRLLKLFNLIVHFELNDFNYLNSGTRSLERELRKSKRSFHTEKVILNLMKLYPQALSRSARRKLFEKALTELSSLKNDAYERQLFYVFDFGEWIRLKTEVPIL